MKFRAIFRFEVGYQAGRLATWLYVVVLAVFAALLARVPFLEQARTESHHVNAPFVIASITVFSSVIWLLMTAGIAGDAAARDVQTRIHPLVYTMPIDRASYLGGRLLAAFVVNALVLLAVPCGMLLAFLAPGVEPALIGPLRPTAFLAAYGFIALPTAFAATTIQFAVATRDRRALASYVASMVIFVIGHLGGGIIGSVSGQWHLAKLVDPIGIIGVVRFFEAWAPIEKNTRLFIPDGWQTANRLLWIALALAAFAFTVLRFRFDHQAESRSWRRRFRRRRYASSPTSAETVVAPLTAITIPDARRTFGFATHVRQTLALAWVAFLAIAKSRAGLTLVAVFAVPVAVLGRGFMMVTGVPILPTTGRVVDLLTAPLTDLRTPWILIPLLIIYYAGELVWRERDAGVSDIADAAPVSEWTLLVGRLIGLGFAIVAWLSILMVAGLLMQVDGRYRPFEIGLYLRALFGLQLTEYLLFAALVLVIHGVVNQKYVGHLAALLAYGCIAAASRLGIEDPLVVYGSSPLWSYTDLRGFGASLGPWLWFKGYWIAWAVLMAVSAKLLWVRGRDQGVRQRLRLARGRFARPTARIAAMAVSLVLVLGGFIFYKRQVVAAASSASDGTYRRLPQPQVTSTSLRVEIHPRRRVAEIRGEYTLENRSGVAIDAIHLALSREVETGAVTFDRPATVTKDDDLRYRIYALQQPLQPGHSLRMKVDVRHEPRGFRDSGPEAAVVANGTYFTNLQWMPGIGQRTDRMTFDAIVGTDDDQIAVAPGALRRTWTEGGRRYFHYATDGPIQNVYAFYSAKYVLHEAQWRPSTGSAPAVTVRIFQHPTHTRNLERIVRAVGASLDYYTEQFGSYPFSHLTIVERGSHGDALHAEGTAIDYGERFALLSPMEGPHGLDIVFFGIAHEVAHQWWGPRVTPARGEGEVFLAEGLANYSAMRVLEKTYGYPQLQRYLSQVLWASYQMPRARAAVPLLRANNAFLGYRKGAHVMYALSRYLGEEPVNNALRRMVEKYGAGEPPRPTPLDLYRELQAVTPESLRPLLHDLFEANTFWELEMRRATAQPTKGGAWQVTLDVRTRKVVVDETGVETVAPMNDWVEIGVFEGGDKGEPLYLQKHRLTSGEQTMTVTVPRKPARAGIDPSNLLIDWQVDDNVRRVKAEG